MLIPSTLFLTEFVGVFVFCLTALISFSTVFLALVKESKGAG